MKILIDNGHGRETPGKRSPDGTLREYAWNRLIACDAPASQVAVPNVSYSQVAITPQLIVFGGIVRESSPYKLVVKMSGSQSAGISNGWSKTVIISSEVEDDWGEADVTKLYLKTIGVEPTPGQKVFIESYWVDTSTGFTGQIFKDSVIVTGESSFTPRKRVTMDRLAPERAFYLVFTVKKAVVIFAVQNIKD